MITISADGSPNPCVRICVEDLLVHYVNTYGPIVGLDKWANDLGFAPWWVRSCAHRAAQKGLLQLTRLETQSGRPYRVSALEEETT